MMQYCSVHFREYPCTKINQISQILFFLHPHPRKFQLFFFGGAEVIYCFTNSLHWRDGYGIRGQINSTFDKALFFFLSCRGKQPKNFLFLLSIKFCQFCDFLKALANVSIQFSRKLHFIIFASLPCMYICTYHKIVFRKVSEK